VVGHGHGHDHDHGHDYGHGATAFVTQRAATPNYVRQAQGAGLKAPFQGEVSHLAERRRVVVVVNVTVAVAVADHFGRSGHGESAGSRRPADR
jgi:hypothetical protein